MTTRGRSRYVVLLAALLPLVSACGGGSQSQSHAFASTALPDPSARPSAPHASASSSSAPRLYPTQLLYYLGPGPDGPLLHHVTMARTPGSNAADTATYGLEEAPDDHRLHSEWQPGWISSAKRGPGTIDVELGATPAARPPGMDEATAEASVQQLVYTMQSAFGSHDPVRFLRGGRPVGSVLGVATGSPVPAAPFEQVMALVSVLEPESDEEVAGRRPYTAAGTALTADRRVTVRLEQGARVLATRTVALGSKIRDGEYPWQATFEIKGLTSGLYRVIASGQDPNDPSRTQTDQAVLRLD